MTTPTTDNNFIDVPPPTITDIILPPPTMTATNTTCPNPATSVATSDYLSPATSNTTTAANSSDGDSVLTCPHCDRTFTSHIVLVGLLQIHRTETSEIVPGAPTHSRDHRLQCPHCPRAFTHRMGLIGPMRIHVSGIHRDANTSCAPIKTSLSPPLSSTTSSSCRAPPTYLVFIVTAHAHRASAWSATCESIAHRPANLRTPAAPDSTLHTAHAHYTQHGPIRSFASPREPA
ncbi:unnamed protein product [Schistocephalus solidus]|uniref:C2H2-type domain-containing protein n=1 Tax=Schistocephalus solidus TaxID=70667 RepID=A0A183TI18_SCHSO|nr:unnamed protein product [Schistocephalus solidus]